MARIVFLLRKLEGGGAERQLLNLAQGLAQRGHDVHIVVWVGGGKFEDRLPAEGVEYHIVDRGRAYDVGGLLYRVASLLRRLRPDVLHGYMDTGNFVAAAMRPVLPAALIVWGVRSSGLDLREYDTAGRVLHHVSRPLSRLAGLIIANSSAGRRHALEAGYPSDRIRVIPNGIDTGAFRPCERAAADLRQSLGYAPEHQLIGMAARLDPMKDHETFAVAARIAHARNPAFRFVCVGEGIEPYRSVALAALSSAGLGDVIRWSGFARDMPAFFSSLDIATSTSRFGEGFSNSIAEAMACGTPCVATDVGDAAEILGDTGRLVPPRDPVALAGAWESLLATTDEAERQRCRARVVERFGLQRLVEDTERLLLSGSTIS